MDMKSDLKDITTYKGYCMTKKRLKLYYFLWSILGGIIVLFSLFLNIKRAGTGVLVEFIVVWFVFLISQKEFKTGFLIIGVISLLEFVLYNLYCSSWTATICHRNLFIISITPIFFFGTFWLVNLVNIFITNISRPNKTKY